jgi:hypothetical protein
MLIRIAHAAAVLALVAIGWSILSDAMHLVVATVREGVPPTPTRFFEFIALGTMASWAWASALVLGMPFIGLALRLLDRRN